MTTTLLVKMLLTDPPSPEPQIGLTDQRIKRLTAHIPRVVLPSLYQGSARPYDYELPQVPKCRLTTSPYCRNVRLRASAHSRAQDARMALATYPCSSSPPRVEFTHADRITRSVKRSVDSASSTVNVNLPLYIVFMKISSLYICHLS